jgi:non-specific serine/threonine protein kinase
VRLFGAAEALREEIQVPLPSADHALNAPALDAAKQVLEQHAFSAAWRAGRTTLPQTAIVDALALADALTSAEPAPEATPAAQTLTQREQQVALLVAHGQTNRQIAADLGMANRTVDTHVSNVLHKLGLTSRSDVATWAATQGTTSHDPSQTG